MSRNRLHLCFMVWGEPFLAALASTTLPTLLSPNNLPTAARNAEVVIHVYTDQASLTSAQRVFAPLEAFGALHLHPFETTQGKVETIATHARPHRGASLKHEINVQSTHHLIELVLREDAAGIIALMDNNFLIADGTLTHGLEALKTGAHAYFLPTLRLTAEALDPAMWAHGVSARTLVKTFPRALHPTTRACWATAAEFSSYPAQILWPVEKSGGEEESLCRAFFPHLFLFHPVPSCLDAVMTADYDLGLRAAGGPEHLASPASSDEGLICKLTPTDYAPVSGEKSPLSLGGLAHFLLASTNHRHRELAARPFRLVTGTVDDAAWRSCEATSLNILDQAYALAERALAELPPDEPEVQAARNAYLGSLDDFSRNG